MQERPDAGSALLAVEESGRGEPLVLLHDLATTRAIWGPVVPALASDRRVLTVDLPGFGDSAPAGPGFELEAVATRIARGMAGRGVRGRLTSSGIRWVRASRSRSPRSVPGPSGA